MCSREAAKSHFFSGPSTKALPTSSLVATFFSSFKKSYFFLVARPLPSPLLVTGQLKKVLFFAATFKHFLLSCREISPEIFGAGAKSMIISYLPASLISEFINLYYLL